MPIDWDRARLADLLSGPDGKLAQTQNRLLGLVRNWSQSNVNLALIFALGGDLNNPETKTYASMLVGQFNGALHDHFVSRMSKPPLSSFQLLNHHLTLAREDKIVVAFFRLCLQSARLSLIVV